MANEWMRHPRVAKAEQDVLEAQQARARGDHHRSRELYERAGEALAAVAPSVPFGYLSTRSDLAVAAVEAYEQALRPQRAIDFARIMLGQGVEGLTDHASDRLSAVVEPSLVHREHDADAPDGDAVALRAVDRGHRIAARSGLDLSWIRAEVFRRLAPTPAVVCPQCWHVSGGFHEFTVLTMAGEERKRALEVITEVIESLAAARIPPLGPEARRWGARVRRGNEVRDLEVHVARDAAGVGWSAAAVAGPDHFPAGFSRVEELAVERAVGAFCHGFADNEAQEWSIVEIVPPGEPSRVELLRALDEHKRHRGTSALDGLVRQLAERVIPALGDEYEGTSIALVFDLTTHDWSAIVSDGDNEDPLWSTREEAATPEAAAAILALEFPEPTLPAGAAAVAVKGGVSFTVVKGGGR